MGHKNKEDYDTPLNLYRQYRGFLTIQSLADAAGLSRQTMSLACSGERNLKPENLQRVADLLYVDPCDLVPDWSLKDPCENVFNIPDAVDRIKKNISICPAKSLQTKADRIVSYLSTEDSSLESALRYLLFCATETAISLLVYILAIPVRDTPDADRDCGEAPAGENREKAVYKDQKDTVEGDTILDKYRKQRGLTFTQLAQLAHIPRQTVSKLCKGLQKPNWNQLIALAQALHVDAVDLEGGHDPLSHTVNVVNITKETAKILDAVNRCRPTPLRLKIDCILAYLKNTNPELDAILARLLDPSSPKEFDDILENTKVMYGIAQFYRDYGQYIEIGYTFSPEDQMVSAYVLFEPWVYELFCLPSPVHDLKVPLKDGYGHTITKGMDFPLDIDTSLSPEDDGFEDLLIMRAEEYCIDQEADTIPFTEIEDIFCRYVYDNLWTARIIPWEFMDLDLERPARLEKRRKQYQTLISHLMSQYEGVRFVQEISSILSRMKEDTEYEQKLFEELGLGQPV